MTQRKKILLVEGDGFTRFMMQEIRDSLGVDIDIAASATDGFDRYCQNPAEYGVVLMDPEIPGETASLSIRDLEGAPSHEVPIIAVTSDERFSDDTLLTERGMNGYLSKPVTPGEVMALIDRYC